MQASDGELGANAIDLTSISSAFEEKTPVAQKSKLPLVAQSLECEFKYVLDTLCFQVSTSQKIDRRTIIRYGIFMALLSVNFSKASLNNCVAKWKHPLSDKEQFSASDDSFHAEYRVDHFMPNILHLMTLDKTKVIHMEQITMMLADYLGVRLSNYPVEAAPLPRRREGANAQMRNYFSKKVNAVKNDISCSYQEGQQIMRHHLFFKAYKDSVDHYYITTTKTELGSLDRNRIINRYCK